jgi:MFS family permease
MQLDNIGESLHNSAAQTWVPNALSLVQAVLSPIISSASDTFQARKPIMVVCCLVSFVGSAIAPGSQSIYRLIVAQVLIGFGFSSTALAYCVPSEILPKKWRPSTLHSLCAVMNIKRLLTKEQWCRPL